MTDYLAENQCHKCGKKLNTGFKCEVCDTMADKEERILIDIIEPGLNCVYRMDNDPKGLSLCKHNGEEEPVSEKDCKNCLEGMTRQEAIEVMAKRLEYEGVNKFECHTIAEWCLDELLEGVKK